MFDRYKLKYFVGARGTTLTELAKAMGINSVTLARKMNGTSDFSRKEIQDIKEYLKLTDEQALDIFFG